MARLKKNSTKFPGFLKRETTKRMRYLDFTNGAIKGTNFEKVSELYEFIYDGCINTPRGFDKQETRVIGKVFNKLESVATSAERGGRKTYVLNDSGGCVALEDAEFKLLNDSLESQRWTGVSARRASDMFDWLEKAPKEPPIKIVPTEEILEERGLKIPTKE